MRYIPGKVGQDCVVVGFVHGYSVLNAGVRFDVSAVYRCRVSTILVGDLSVVYKMKRPASRVPLRFGTLVEVGLPVVVVFTSFGFTRFWS